MSIHTDPDIIETGTIEPRSQAFDGVTVSSEPPPAAPRRPVVRRASERVRDLVDAVWAQRFVGPAVGIGAAAVWGLAAGWWTPRGPLTSGEAIWSIALGLVVGATAGLAHEVPMDDAGDPGHLRRRLRAGSARHRRTHRRRHPHQHVRPDRLRPRAGVPRLAVADPHDARCRHRCRRRPNDDANPDFGPERRSLRSPHGGRADRARHGRPHRRPGSTRPHRRRSSTPTASGLPAASPNSPRSTSTATTCR